MPCTIIAGGQWGDEAKGKIASYLALTDDVDLACRGGVGPGAGHTVVHQGREYKLRHVPSAMPNQRTRLLLGAGVLLKPAVLLGEVQEYGLDGRVGVDPRASIIEAAQENTDRSDPHLAGVVKSTGSGHGPCMADRALRTARLARDVAELEPLLCDVEKEINEALDAHRSVQVEGTCGFLLSVLWGTYPFAIGKDATASTIAADVGIGPRRVDEVVLVFKAFPTRVGDGPFPTEMSSEEALRRGFVEHGTVTGRLRRVGEFDFELARQAVRVNHPTALALTFIDRLDPQAAGKRFEQLDATARAFVDRVEDELGVAVTLLGTGPGTFDTIDRR